MVIPKNIVEVGNHICTFGMVVYAEATSQPERWDDGWNWNGGKFGIIDYYWYSEKDPGALKRRKYWHYVDGVATIWGK